MQAEKVRVYRSSMALLFYRQMIRQEGARASHPMVKILHLVVNKFLLSWSNASHYLADLALKGYGCEYTFCTPFWLQYTQRIVICALPILRIGE